MDISSAFIIFGAKYLIGAVVLGAAAFWLMQSKEVKKTLVIRALIAFPVTVVLARIASMLWYNARPFVVEGITPLVAHAADNGFPSDHTLLSAACAALVFSQNKKWGGVLYVLAILVGVARVFADVHHVVDIVTSLVIASAVMFKVWYFQQKWHKKQHLQNPVAHV